MFMLSGKEIAYLTILDSINGRKELIFIVYIKDKMKSQCCCVVFSWKHI